MHDFGIFIGDGKSVDGGNHTDSSANFFSLNASCHLFYDELDVPVSKYSLYEGYETEHSPDSAIYLAIVDSAGR
jgi:hypothetical protein